MRLLHNEESECSQSSSRDVEASDQFQLLVENIADYAIFMLDEKGFVRTWNVGAQLIKGYVADEIIGRHFSAFYPAEDRALGRPEAALAAAERTGRYTEEGWRVRKDGNRFWASVIISAVRDENGTLRGFGKITRDLTGPRAAANSIVAAREMHTATLESLAEGVVLYHLDHRCRPIPDYVNRSGEVLLGMTLRELQAVSFRSAVPSLFDEDGHPLSLEQMPVAVTAATGSAVEGFVWGMSGSDGRSRWLRSTSRPVISEGKLTGVVMSMTDVTVEHLARLELRAAHDQFSSLLEHSSDVICVLDPDGKITFASPAFRTVFGREPEGAYGTLLTELVVPMDREIVEGMLERVLAHDGSVTTVSLRSSPAEGEVRHLELTAASRTHDPMVRGIVGNVRDVTERVETMQHVAFQAAHDPLTGLANRSALLEHLSRALRPSRSITKTAVLYIDLDRFKTVNDSYGHSVGDALLVAVADRFREHLASGHVVARLGGDEFVLVVEGAVDRDAVLARAELVQTALVEPFEVSGRTLSIGASVGIAFAGDSTPEMLLQEADTALYRAKNAGSGRIEIYGTKMRREAQQRIETEATLRKMIRASRLIVHYQPIVELATARVTAHEALVRLPGDSGTLIAPDEFIPIAEDSGLIIELGDAVLDAACRQQAEWNRGKGEPHTQIAVNLSARQLFAGGFVDRVVALLEANALCPKDLCLELTETAFIEATPTAMRTIGDLAALGVQLSLDDFGTGWSSLAYLRRFPISQIKVDRSFISGLEHHPSDMEITKAIIALGHALDLSVTAEGVENSEQAHILAELGCDHAQGYYYGAPTVGSRG